MSQMENELQTLRARIAVLEEQKRQQEAKELNKKLQPLSTLEKFVREKKERWETIKGCKIYQTSEQKELSDKIEFLEPILYALKNIQERLDTLEKKQG